MLYRFQVIIQSNLSFSFVITNLTSKIRPVEMYCFVVSRVVTFIREFFTTSWTGDFFGGVVDH